MSRPTKTAVRAPVGAPIHQVKAEFFKTLGHPARIRILELVCQRDHAVHELLELIDIEPSNLSQQLGVLRRTQLVVCTRRGGEVIYSAATPRIGDLLLAARQLLAEVHHAQDRGELT